MKRVASLDILRGIAIFVVILTHTFIKTVDMSIFDISTSPILLFVVLSPLILLGKWKGFFVMISAAAHIFNLDREFATSHKKWLIILNHLINSVILLGVAYFYKIFLLPDTTIVQWIFTGNWDPTPFIPYVQFSDTLELIAICRIINTFFYSIISIGKNLHKPYVKMIIFGIFAVLAIILTPLIVKLVFNSTGLTPDNIRSTSGVDNELDRIIRIFLALLVGQQDPLFPYLSSAFVGAIIGILYNQQHISKKKCLYTGFSSCLLLVLIGLILLPFSTNIVDDIWNHIHAPWLLLINLGLQLACVFFLMSKIEFNPNNSKIVRRLRFFQRFGLVSLTIFCVELVDFFPRWIVTTLFQVDVMWGKTDNFLILLLLVALNLLLWAGIIRMWEVIRFYGTLESGMKIISSILMKNKINFKDPLNVQDILYESEPVIFDKFDIKNS